jgi:hypothetical protein
MGALAWFAGCGAPPWRMGAPLDGHPSIPRGSARPTAEQARATAARERAAGRTVLELMALLEIDGDEKLTAADRARLVDLAGGARRGVSWPGTPIPESADLEAVARLDPVRGAQLVTARAVAAVAAGGRVEGDRRAPRGADRLHEGDVARGNGRPASSACARYGRLRPRPT